MTYEELLNVSDKENLIVKEKNIPGYGGRIYKNRIAIHQGIDTQIEKACILAEELGHHYTTVGNILDQDEVANRKQELRARLWAYNHQIGLIGIIRAYEHGCRKCYRNGRIPGCSRRIFARCLSAATVANTESVLNSIIISFSSCRRLLL